MGEQVEIIDVAPRDGLQNHAVVLAPDRRAHLVDRLLTAGVDLVEAAAFVSSRRVAQMGGAEQVVAGIDRSRWARLTALVPNRRGFERAAGAGLRHVRCVVVASDRLNEANFGVPTAVTLATIRDVATRAQTRGMAFGVVIGGAFGCPYEGVVKPSRVLDLARQVVELGADEIVLADTIGVAQPSAVRRLCGQLVALGVPRPGCHLHDTGGMGYANALRALDAGIRRFDASLGGLGGCPYAPGSAGNVSTEQLARLLVSEGMRVAIQPELLAAAAAWLEQELGGGDAVRPPGSGHMYTCGGGQAPVASRMKGMHEDE